MTDSTDGRTRSTIDRKFLDSVLALPEMASKVAVIAPHWE
jgi:hypothetical protein